MADRALGLVCLILSVGMAWMAWGYEAPISYEPVGPAAFPLLLAAMMGVLSLWLMLRPGAQHTASGPATHAPALWGPASPKVLKLAAVMAVYAITFQWLGFVVATALMTVGVSRIFGGTWRQSTLTGLGLGVALFLIFDRLFDVILPAGWLSFMG
ncbi:tripartite tricarboxylate transporter TctB family protein [Aquabacterium sp. A3]|uniref:tripartite tricarboxylate transporter TctB family protein n=1 Tax=Aquabacterium sp. A3 TaxID=3132829 RepID=UPI00311A6E15